MDSDKAGSPGASGVRIVTRQYLFDHIKNKDLPNLNAKLDFLKNELFSNKFHKEDQIVSLKRCFNRFKSEIMQRWIKSYYKEDIFIKSNQSWLAGTFEIPVAENIQNRSGRPFKSVEEVCERSKRRKTEEIRYIYEKDKILHAAQVELGKSGQRDASNVLKDLTSTPKRATKYKKAYLSKKDGNERPSLTPMQALQMFIDAELTQAQYEIIRKTNKKFFPCFSRLQKAKKQCYPPQDSFTITNTSAEAQLQPLMDITIKKSIGSESNPGPRIDNSSTTDKSCL